MRSEDGSYMRCAKVAMMRCPVRWTALHSSLLFVLQSCSRPFTLEDARALPISSPVHDLFGTSVSHSVTVPISRAVCAGRAPFCSNNLDMAFKPLVFFVLSTGSAVKRRQGVMSIWLL